MEYCIVQLFAQMNVKLFHSGIQSSCYEIIEKGVILGKNSDQY